MSLLQTVNQLAMETRRVMKGNHSRKTAAFVRVGLFFYKMLIGESNEKLKYIFFCITVMTTGGKVLNSQ